MIKAVEENENYDNKILMRIQFILDVHRLNLCVQTKIKKKKKL